MMNAPRRQRPFRDVATTVLSWCGVLALGVAGCSGAAPGEEPPPDAAPAGPPAGAACPPRRGAPTNLLQSALPAGTPYDQIGSDGQWFYFAGIRSIYRVSLSGGPVETLYDGPLAGPAAAGPGAVAWLAGSPDHVTGVMVRNAGGAGQVPLPDGVALPDMGLVLDAQARVYLHVTQGGGGPHLWRWSPGSVAAAAVPGIGDGAVGATALFADRGQIIWSSRDGAGIYATDVSTDVRRQLVPAKLEGFGTVVGLDATNYYGARSTCPRSACTLTVNGVARAGGEAPFVAFQSDVGYWTNGPAADDSGLYWIDWETRAIYHAALAPAGRAELLVDLRSSPTIPARLMLDTCNVYWLEDNAGGVPRVMALGKPPGRAARGDTDL